MTMLEKVARALQVTAPPVEWGYTESFMEDAWRDMARAAIEAIWEPTPEMWRAFREAEPWDSAEDIWRAMIDVALEEKAK